MPQRPSCVSKSVEISTRRARTRVAPSTPTALHLTSGVKETGFTGLCHGGLPESHFIPRSLGPRLSPPLSIERSPSNERQDTGSLYEVASGCRQFRTLQARRPAKTATTFKRASPPSRLDTVPQYSPSRPGSGSPEKPLDNHGSIPTASPRQADASPTVPRHSAATTGADPMRDEAPRGHVLHSDAAWAAVKSRPVSISGRTQSHQPSRIKPQRRAASAPDLAIPSVPPEPAHPGAQASITAYQQPHSASQLDTVADTWDSPLSSLSSLSSLSPEPPSRLQHRLPPSTSQTAVILPPLDMSDAQWEEPCCMFVKDCTTGSQLRKAISHLFGRNKSCTLRIPKKVWVYYCRKHYQRVRYRNAKTYPLNQMELVRLQIRRLHAWSLENQRSSNGPFIKAWTLSLRKREKNRLSQGVGIDTADDGDGQSGPAAPEWLLQRLGSGFSTEQMMETADRLHGDIKDGTLSQVPEIEFLPDITSPEDGVSRSCAGRTRKHADDRPPKRKASDVSEGQTGIQAPSKRARTTDIVRDGPPSMTTTTSSWTPPALPAVSPVAADHRMAPTLPRMPFFDQHTAGLTNTHHPSQAPTYRRTGPEPWHSAFRWHGNGDGAGAAPIRLPSISAQFGADEMRPLHRGRFEPALPPLPPPGPLDAGKHDSWQRYPRRWEYDAPATGPYRHHHAQPLHAHHGSEPYPWRDAPTGPGYFPDAGDGR